jgi:adenine-specific DNA-methyltransferase
VKTAELILLEGKVKECISASIEDLVVVAEFRDLIYPGLLSTGKVITNKDKPLSNQWKKLPCIESSNFYS